MIKFFKNSKFSFIMSVITFLIGVMFQYISYGDPLSFRIWILLLGYFPFFFYVMVTFINNKYSDNDRIINIFCDLTAFVTVSLLFYYLFAFIMSAFIECDHPITNVKYYNKLRTRLFTNFPKKIPENSQNVQFCYIPGILQGGTMSSLYFIDDDLDLKCIDEKYRNQAIWVGSFKQYNTINRLETIKISFCYEEELENKNDFLIYLLEGHCDDSGYCNHGSYEFVAVNAKTKEVLFTSYAG